MANIVVVVVGDGNSIQVQARREVEGVVATCIVNPSLCANADGAGMSRGDDDDRSRDECQLQQSQT